MSGDVIYIASKNTHKVTEFRSLLQPLHLPICELPVDCPESPEMGATFEENALQKAKFYGYHVEGWVLADDSGLCVDHLHGEPGIHSARYAGGHGNDKANNQKLLRMLEGVPQPQRTAEFVCVLVLWNRLLETQFVVRGSLSGQIVEQPSGEAGFGYDPLFFLPQYKKTVAELGVQEKNRISHRARAVSKLIQVWEAHTDASMYRE